MTNQTEQAADSHGLDINASRPRRPRGLFWVRRSYHAGMVAYYEAALALARACPCEAERAARELWAVATVLYNDPEGDPVADAAVRKVIARWRVLFGTTEAYAAMRQAAGR